MKASKAAIALTSVFSFCAGVLLMILPWSEVWKDNYFLQVWPFLEPLFLHRFSKIVVTALGVLDFAIGILEMRRLGQTDRSIDHPAG